MMLKEFGLLQGQTNASIAKLQGTNQQGFKTNCHCIHAIKDRNISCQCQHYELYSSQNSQTG